MSKWVLFFCLLLNLGLHADEPKKVRKILVMGDSWAAGMSHVLLGNVFQKTLESAGLTSVLSYAPSETAVPGSKASEFASNHKGKLDAVRKALQENPSIHVVFMTLGGNDFNARALEKDLSAASPEALRTIYQGIGHNIEKVILEILKVRPDLKIVLCDYDYFNLSANSKSPIPLHFHGISQAAYNRMLVDLGREKKAIATALPQVLYVHNWGLFQHRLGDKNEGYEAGKLPGPGVPPTYAPYPGGDPGKPSPAEAFNNGFVNDGFHPNANGYELIVLNALNQGMKKWLE